LRIEDIEHCKELIEQFEGGGSDGETQDGYYRVGIYFILFTLDDFNFIIFPFILFYLFYFIDY